MNMHIFNWYTCRYGKNVAYMFISLCKLPAKVLHGQFHYVHTNVHIYTDFDLCLHTCVCM